MNPPQQPALSPPLATPSVPTAAPRELILDELLLGSSSVGPRIPQPRSFTRPDPETEPRVQRRLRRSIILFLITCVTTFYAGALGWRQQILGEDPAFSRGAWENLETRTRGLEFMASVMAILLAHEMGHFIMTVRHRIAATFPIFIPFPSLFSGTLGAVIVMDHTRANRKQVFDIGIAGPLAGLVLIIPVLCYGIQNAHSINAKFAAGQLLGDPWLVTILTHWLRPELGPHDTLILNPWLMAGWVGCFITGLNMLPMSQLDGGHVVYCLFGKWGNVIVRWTLLAAMGAIIVSNYYLWTVMILLLTIVLGVNHPPTADDTVPLGRTRTILGCLSLAIPVLCFIPRPFL